MAQARTVARLLVVSALLLFASYAAAQAPEIPAGTGPIPALKKGAKGGVLVYAEHVPKYRAVLPEEVADLVSRGRLVLDVADIELPEAPQAAAQPAQADLQVKESGELSAFPSRVSMPFFSDQSLASSGGNKREQGYKVLWNSAATLWSRTAFTQRASLVLFPSDDSSGKQLELTVGRLYSAALGATVGSAKVLFRERISFQAPEVLKGLSWLTFRFVGQEADYLWASSALIRKVRQLTGSNRSDEIFSGAFSPDSLFVWSGKVEAVVPVAVARRTLLVPFDPEPFAAVQGRAASCTTADFGKRALVLNRDSHRFPQHPGWIPTGVRFVPRGVWQVDFTSRDPFSLDVMQRVFVDERTQLPAYRMSWGQDGRLRHVTMGVIGFVQNGAQVQPWLVAQLIRNGPAGTHATIAAQSLEQCAEAVPGLSPDEFDPAALVEPEKPAPAAGQSGGTVNAEELGLDEELSTED